jgi:drug/metabolite transporter (DMT)-like permease
MWVYILIRRLPYKIGKESVKMMAVICLSYIGLASTLYLSFNYISGSLATIVSFTFPPIIIAIEMITKMEPVRIAKIVAVVLAMAGMVCIVGKPEMGGELIGIIFAFGTAICYVVYIMGLSAKRIKENNALVVAGYVLLSSAVFNFFRCLISGQPLFTQTPVQLGYMLILAIVCAFFAILLYCVGVKLVGPGNAAIINTFEPAVACVLGYLLIGDLLTKNMLIGAGLIIIAVLIASMPKQK